MAKAKLEIPTLIKDDLRARATGTSIALSITDEQRAEALKRKGDRVISMGEFCKLVDLHRSTVHRKLKSEPDFPRPIRTRKVRLSFWESDAYVYLLKRQDQSPTTTG